MVVLQRARGVMERSGGLVIQQLSDSRLNFEISMVCLDLSSFDGVSRPAR